MSEQPLYLMIDEDGKPASHPIIEQNLRDIFENFYDRDPPKGFVKFVKTPMPQLGPYEKYDYLEYAYSPELSEQYKQPTWHEVHHIATIENDERKDIIKSFKKLNPDLQDWVYDENLKSLVPPIPKPDDGKEYLWNTDHKEWMEAKPEMHFDKMIEVAKELGYDLAAGLHGKPKGVTEEMVNEIIAQIRKENVNE
jgi:hypothetical protein